MIVAKNDFEKIIEKFCRPGLYGLDTETTGLSQSDRLFSIILADEDDGYYFNFNSQPDHLGALPPEQYILPRQWISRFNSVLGNPESTFFIHNAKFDKRMLSKEGLRILGLIHCTEALERVRQNNLLGHKPYSLASCAKRLGKAKDDAVETYIQKNKLVKKILVPGKKKPFELKFFDKVPFAIMSKYGINDGVLHRELGLDQLREFKTMQLTAPNGAPDIWAIVENERKLTKVCADIEAVGMKINRPYVQEALSYEQQMSRQAQEEFKRYTGLEFQDSRLVLADAFTKMGEKFPTTAKGNPSFSGDVLEGMTTPIASLVQKIRGHEKLISTYYSSFLHFAGKDDILHANMRQGGTETGRFSYSDPNLQNLPKEDEPEDLLKQYLVRGSFTPRLDFCFAMIDFNQQEFRMMLDYAGEAALIKDIMSGTDVHEATANFLGITRKQAKTINFGLLYGMGTEKLAKALGVPVQEAARLKYIYFSKLPRVKGLIQAVIGVGRERGYIWNWAGRRCHISSPEFAYVLPNHLIQGGCADVVKFAMVKLADFLADKKTRMICQVHDEILFEVHKSELHLIPELKTIMESIYTPKNGLYLTCSVEHSWKSWSTKDKIKGLPLAA